jgi:hypothetical protein
MEYRGIEYQVVLADVERDGARAGWRWSIRIDPYTSATGTEGTRPAAIGGIASNRSGTVVKIVS